MFHFLTRPVFLDNSSPYRKYNALVWHSGYDEAHRHDDAVEAKCKVHDRTVHVSERSRLRGNRRPRCATRRHCIDIGKGIYANVESDCRSCYAAPRRRRIWWINERDRISVPGCRAENSEKQLHNWRTRSCTPPSRLIRRCLSWC